MTLKPVSSHSLAGLFKWLTREQWRVPFNATLDRHLRRACETFEIEADEIASILGEMVRSPEMMKRRLREGIEFFRFLREREVAL